MKHSTSSGNRNYSEQVGDRVRIYLRGSVWWAVFQVAPNVQRKRSLKVSNKKEARRKAILLDAELLKGEYLDRKRIPAIKFVTDAYELTLKSEGKAAGTREKYELVTRRVLELASERKARLISEIDMTFVDAYRAKRVAAGASSKTLLTETVIIRQVVNFALARDLIRDDPLKNLKLRKVTPSPQPCWNRKEVEQILDVASTKYLPALTILADTGMRVGELRHLTWDDVDLENGNLHVRAKGEWKPKTGDQRVIPMGQRLRDVLAQLPHKSTWVVTAPPTPKFPAGDRQISNQRLLAHLKTILKRLGLRGHIHTLRHSFISAALLEGIPEAVVRSWVGHVDRDTLKIYTHIADSASKDAMQKFAAANDAQRTQRDSGS